MKKYWHIALMLFCVLMITSCGDDDEALEVDEVWKVQNEEAFQAQMLVPGFEQLSSQSNAGFILYKVLTEYELCAVGNNRFTKPYCTHNRFCADIINVNIGATVVARYFLSVPIPAVSCGNFISPVKK